MGVNYLLDTNIIIYYLQRLFPNSVMAFVDEIFKTSKPCFSVITEIELLCWKTPTLNDIKLLQRFINDSTVIELDSSIKYKTAYIRQNCNIKLPDAIIAATALVNNFTLVTRNISDFSRIEGLKTINPWEL